MARPKIEQIEKLKSAAIELPAEEFYAFYEWIMLLAEVREALAKRAGIQALREVAAECQRTEGAGK